MEPQSPGTILKDGPIMYVRWANPGYTGPAWLRINPKHHYAHFMSWEGMVEAKPEWADLQHGSMGS